MVGVLGFAGVISGQLIAGRREDRRWRRELVRERDNRRHEERAAGYAQLIGAVESLDVVLYEARQAPGELGEHLITELRQHTATLRNNLGVVNLQAPERIRVMLRNSLLPRLSLSRLLLANVPVQDDHSGNTRELWDTGQSEYRALRAEMRRDLGLDAEDL
ncbi:MAG: hypothetical protein QOI21_3384 [Actinomycetota bacterium]|jgi:hypothetical protein|nr:hypothetical protein [Actinomycetota bacterium]